jgi:hypothetical protein
VSNSSAPTKVGVSKEKGSRIFSLKLAHKGDGCQFSWQD